MSNVGVFLIADKKSSFTNRAVVDIDLVKAFTEGGSFNSVLPGASDFGRRWILWVVASFEDPERILRLWYRGIGRTRHDVSHSLCK